MNLIELLNSGAVNLLWMAVAVGAGAFVQSAVGFGFGMLGVPLLVWSGNSLPFSVALVIGAVVVQTLWHSWLFRADVPWRACFPMIAVRWFALPVGVLLLQRVDAAGQAVAKQLIGGFVLLALALQELLKVTPRPRVSLPWTALAGVASGIFAGMLGMGGPPVVLWVMAHQWSADTSRAALWTSFASLAPVLAGLLWWRLGSPALLGLAYGVALSPVMWLGSRAGLALGARLPHARLRALMRVLLVTIALASLAAPWLGT